MSADEASERVARAMDRAGEALPKREYAKFLGNQIDELGSRKARVERELLAEEEAKAAGGS